MARTAKLIDASPATVGDGGGPRRLLRHRRHQQPTVAAPRPGRTTRPVGPLLTKERRGPLQDRGVRLTAARSTATGQRRGKTPQSPRHSNLPQTATRHPETSGHHLARRHRGPDRHHKADGQPIALQVTSLRRLPGGLGLLTYTITNQGSAEAWFRETSTTLRTGRAYKCPAATNVRHDRRRRPPPVPARPPRGPHRRRRGLLLRMHSSLRRPHHHREVRTRPETREFWNLFALPDTADTLNVKIGPFRDLNVPIQ